MEAQDFKDTWQVPSLAELHWLNKIFLRDPTFCSSRDVGQNEFFKSKKRIYHIIIYKDLTVLASNTALQTLWFQSYSEIQQWWCHLGVVTNPLNNIILSRNVRAIVVPIPEDCCETYVIQCTHMKNLASDNKQYMRSECLVNVAVVLVLLLFPELGDSPCYRDTSLLFFSNRTA